MNFLDFSYKSDPRKPYKDLALIKMKREVSDIYVLPMCQEEHHTYLGELLGACGLGSVSGDRRNPVYPDILLETYFYDQNYTTSQREFSPDNCKYDQICTEPGFEGSNICYLDDGGPLYAFDLSTIQPKCVIGLASYVTNVGNGCDGYSVFVNLEAFQAKILKIIEQYT